MTAVSETLRFAAALERALAGDAALLEGFGVARATVVSPLWEDRSTLDGAGQLEIRNRRADRGGSSVGRFRATVDKAAVAEVMTRLRELALAGPLPPLRAEPYEPRLFLWAICGGFTFSLVTAVQPGANVALRPLQIALGKLDLTGYASPLATLTVTCALPDGLALSGPTRVRVGLLNKGTEGYWINHPGQVANQKERDKATLAWARLPDASPGVSPAPPTVRRAPLLPSGSAPREELLWIAAGAEEAVDLQAAVEPPGSGTWVFGAQLELEEGPPLVAGKLHLKAAANSLDVRVTIS